MNPIDWLFSLLRKFVPIKETEFASMKMEADQWHLDTINGIKANGEKMPENAFTEAYKTHVTKWYVKLAFAVSWIFAVKVIADFLTEAKDEKNANGKDEDDW